MEREENKWPPPGGRLIGTLFAALFAVICAIAMFPPLYIELTRRHQMIASIPESIWYLVLVSAAGIVATYALWLVDCRRGVVD